jgi:hypothetical protein
MSDQLDYANLPSSEVMVSDAMAPFVAQPERIVRDPTLSAEQKRSILASWLSDVHAVPEAPRWRRLEDGAFVNIHEIRHALHLLDSSEGAGLSSDTHSPASWRRISKGRFPATSRWRRYDDDDDPPPSPVGARVPVPPCLGPDAAAAELAYAA